MDRPLNAHVKLDAAAETVRIDVLGSLTQESRDDLTELTARIRQAGMNAHICVDLSQAQLVESAALAGLRNDLDAVSGSTPGPPGPARTHSATGGFSLELQASADDDAKDFQPLDLVSKPPAG